MWEPISQPGSLSERIVAQVERLISEESLKPGDRLPSEREMAELLGVSRPSVREAVRMLEARGRLKVRHGNGVFVEAPRPQRELQAALAETELTLNELYAMREVLEVPAAAWAAETAGPDQLAAVRTSLTELNTAIEAGEDPDRLRQLDAAFHLAVASAAGNRFLRQTSHVLHNMVLAGMQTTLLIPGRIEVARRDHERVLAAIEARDPAAARRAARAHIRGAHNAAARRLATEVETV